jgi:hypothetical protein
MHMNDFRRKLRPGEKVRFCDLKKFVVGTVKAVTGTLVTIEVEEDGQVKTYHEHRKHV